MEHKIFYAVMINNDDSDWDWGSYDLDKAIAMVKECRETGDDDAYIAVIDIGPDPICIEEIRDFD